MLGTDFDPLFEALGVPIYAGSQHTYALLDEPDTVGEYAVSSSPRITYPTGALNLAEGDALTADGRSYTVRQVTAIDDGALTVARLAYA